MGTDVGGGCDLCWCACDELCGAWVVEWEVRGEECGDERERVAECELRGEEDGDESAGWEERGEVFGYGERCVEE